LGRFDSPAEIVPYSDKHPERCTPQRGAAFVLPGEDEPRVCGGDRDCDRGMPPSTDMPHWRRRVRRSFGRIT